MDFLLSLDEFLPLENGGEHVGQYSIKDKPFKLRLRRDSNDLNSIEILLVGKATQQEYVACTFAIVSDKHEVQANWNAFLLNQRLNRNVSIIGEEINY